MATPPPRRASVGSSEVCTHPLRVFAVVQSRIAAWLNLIPSTVLIRTGCKISQPGNFPCIGDKTSPSSARSPQTDPATDPDTDAKPRTAAILVDGGVLAPSGAVRAIPSGRGMGRGDRKTGGVWARA